jgi:hypothetical protein
MHGNGVWRFERCTFATFDEGNHPLVEMVIGIEERHPEDVCLAGESSHKSKKKSYVLDTN